MWPVHSKLVDNILRSFPEEDAERKGQESPYSPAVGIRVVAGLLVVWSIVWVDVFLLGKVCVVFGGAWVLAVDVVVGVTAISRSSSKACVP